MISLEEQLLIKHLILIKIPNVMDFNVLWCKTVLIKKPLLVVLNISNINLVEELHKPITRKLKKRKVHSAFIDNNLNFYLVNMQLISKFNKGIHFLLCVFDIFSEHAWVIP